jgi:hypothetical protein
MKKIFAAAALATTLMTAGAAHAAKDEPMLPVEFEVTTDSQPALDNDGNVVLDEDGSPQFSETHSFSPKMHTAQVCVADEAGEKFTVDINYLLTASAADMGVDLEGLDKPGEKLDKAVALIGTKMTPEKIEKAAAFIQEAFDLSIGKHKAEEVSGESSSQHMVEDLEKIFTDVIEGKRLNADKPSFEEETGITIGVVGVSPTGMQKGCKP